MLNFYSDTFARLSLTNLKDVGQIGVTLISSILNYRVAILFLDGENKDLGLLAIKGLSQNFISAWNAEEDLVRYLWREIDSPTIVKCDNLEAKISISAKRLGIEEIFLTVPLKVSIYNKEKRIGFAITALPHKNSELKIDIMALDIIASFVSGAITICKMRIDLIEANKKLGLDIAERKKVEEELRLSEEKFRELFEQAGDYAFILNPSDEGGLVIMDANEAACKMHGYTRNELVGMSISELDPELSNERISERLQHLLSGETLKFETVHYRKDGTSFPLEVCTKAVKIAGSPLIIFSTERDITERKQAEEEKFRLEEQLQHAQKMEAIGTLAGGVAHDFNNLLTAIIGYGNLLKTEVGQNDLLMAYVTQILNSAERATNLTHNLLAFSRRQMIIPKPVNVNNIINGLKSFLPRIIGEDIEFSIFPTNQDLTVMADKHHIELLLMNLATNARDAMPDGGRLTIRTEYRELDNEFIKKYGYFSTGSYALISVEDTGQGMDEETKERLFDPFYTTKEVEKGTGLGLSMVYGIVQVLDFQWYME
jgi:PAS domain S-box-containing protein